METSISKEEDFMETNMTNEAQLLWNYKMTANELKMWESLADDIRQAIFSADIPDVTESMITEYVEKNLATSICYEECRGYITSLNGKSGYYQVYCQDRGQLDIIIFSNDYAYVKTAILQRICSAITYNYIISTPYYKEYCKIPTEKLSEEEDYRQYWFTRLLRIEKQVLSENDYLSEVKRYTDSMNYWVDLNIHRWEFNQETMRFCYE